jgi:hypothetical protein
VARAGHPPAGPAHLCCCLVNPPVLPGRPAADFGTSLVRTVPHASGDELTDADPHQHTGRRLRVLTNSSMYFSAVAAAFGNSGRASYVEVAVGAWMGSTIQQ